MATRSRRGMAPKPFVPGGIMTAQQRPLIVLPKQQQQQEQQQVQPSQQFHQQAQQQSQNQSQQQLQLQQQHSQQVQQQQQQQQPPQSQQQPQLKGQNLTNTSVVMEQNPIPVIGSVTVSNAQHQAVQQSQLSENSFKNEMNDALSDDEMSRKSLFRKYLGNRKKASVRAKERRLRQNKRLRKVLVPKNALMALHELRGIKISDFNVMNKTGGGFVCQVTVNNIQYEGFGVSKMNAKSDACEKALRDLFISKMLQRPLSKNPSSEKLDTTDSNADNKNNTVGEVVNNSDDIEMKSVDGSDEDDLPMINLASYALYKLFSEWENEGFEIPEFRSPSAASNASPQGDVKKVPTIRTELPANWETMHPAMLLCMMRPGSSYTDLGTEGALPNQIQKVGITIDGEHFIGSGRSKKVARKDAAIAACNKLFGTNYTHDL